MFASRIKTAIYKKKEEKGREKKESSRMERDAMKYFGGYAVAIHSSSKCLLESNDIKNIQERRHDNSRLSRRSIPLSSALHGMVRGRNFGCNFGLGASSGPPTSKIGGELPTKAYLANVQN
jgi:hypothetical protein